MKYHQKPPCSHQEQRHHHTESRVIYRYKCDRLECDEEYIGDFAKTFGERLKENVRTPFSICHHDITGHQTGVENISIVGRESHNLARTIKEAIYIWVTNPFLNKKLGSTSCPTEGMRSYSTPHTLHTNRACNITQWAYLCHLLTPQG